MIGYFKHRTCRTCGAQSFGKQCKKCFSVRGTIGSKSKYLRGQVEKVTPS